MPKHYSVSTGQPRHPEFAGLAMMHHINVKHMHYPGPSLRKGRLSLSCNDKIRALIRAEKECKPRFQAHPQAPSDDWPGTW